MKSPRHLLLPTIALLIAGAAPVSAQTKMFKCTIDGRTVYQQSGCPVSNQPTDMAPAAQSPTSSAASSVPRVNKRRKAAAMSAVPASEPAARVEPNSGRAQPLQ